MKKIFFIILLLFLPLVSAGLNEDIEIVEEKFQSVLETDQEAFIVKGEYASFLEKSLLLGAKGKFPKVAELPEISEEDVTDFENKTTYLVGGPTQNALTQKVLNDPRFTRDEEEVSFGKVIFLSDGNTKIVIFSDHEGFSNLPRRVDKSPLARVLPVEYIPAAATLIGLSLFWLWKLLLGLFTKVFKFKLADKIMKRIRKKKLKHQYVGLNIKGIRIKAREWIAIIVAAAVFAVSLSYLYLAPETNVFAFFLMSVGVNVIIYSLRHGLRLLFDWHHELHTEYFIWYWGALITAATGWLGNTFGLAGYLVSESESDHSGRISYFVNLVTFLVFVGFFVWNLYHPAIILQMTMLLALSISFLQMLPMTPFAGKKIYQWKKGVWWVTFIPFTIAYIVVNIV